MEDRARFGLERGDRALEVGPALTGATSQRRIEVDLPRDRFARDHAVVDPPEVDTGRLEDLLQPC